MPTDCSTTTTVVPAAVGVAHHVDKVVDHGRGQAEGELVDEEQLGAGHQAHGQREHLLLAAGQVTGPGVDRRPRSAGKRSSIRSVAAQAWSLLRR